MSKGFITVLGVIISVAVVDAITVAGFGLESIGRDGIHFVSTMVLFASIIDKVNDLKGGDNEQR